MENYQIFILIFFLILIANLLFTLHRRNTEVKILKEQLKKYQGPSDEESFGRGKFTELGLMSAGITHEIINPLSIILGRVAKLSKTDVIPEHKTEFQKGLEQIKKNTERINTIIQSVRDYIYRNDEEIEEFISLREMIEDVLMFYSQRLKNHGIELRLRNIDKMYVSGHKGQFEQALLNLMSNSFEAVEKLDEKWIEISAIKKDENVQIYVRDSGHGIPIDVRKKMLQPFFTTKTNKGSGMGLTLVKGIAQKHGGELKYVQNDEHTTFMLQLPEASSSQYHH